MTSYSPSTTARMSGFSLDTLRYYERIGLLSEIRRTSGGRRIFTEEDLGWLEVLRCLRDTGMPISHVQRYADLARQGDDTLAERLGLLEEHARNVEERMELLSRQREHLHGKIAWYRDQLSTAL